MSLSLTHSTAAIVTRPTAPPVDLLPANRMMSKPRYIWWGYVKALIRAAGNPRSRKYSYLSEAEIAAFQSVWESTDQERQKLAAMVLIRQSHTIPGAALKLHISERTAQRWHAEFICAVAQRLGLKVGIKKPK